MRALRLAALVALALLAAPVGAALPQLALACATVPAGQAAPCTITRLSGGQGVYVTLQTSDGSAKAGTDYTATKRLVYLKGSSSSASVAVLTFVNPNAIGTLSFNAAATAGATVVRATGSIVEPAPPTPAPAPSPTFSGETPIADNFDTATGLQVGPTYTHPPSLEEVGAFRMVCSAGQLLRDDPVVYPGQPGASHLHQFWGNTATNAASTYQSLRTTGDSTCDIGAGPVNRTAYWMPAMLDGAGNAVKPDFINTYYKQVPSGSAECIARAKACVGLPNGIRRIFGYNMKDGTGGPTDVNSADYWATRYECWTTPTSGIAAVSPPAGTHFTNIADVAAAGCPAGAGLIIYFAVPGCWDGINVDSADHRSHLVYGTAVTGNQVCPADHPYLITPWQGHVHYTTDANFVAGKWHLSSDEMIPGFVVGPNSPVKAGTSLHFDYWEGWSPSVKAIWQSHCIDGHLNCSGGDTGDGQQIKGADGAVLPPPHQLVPLTSLP